MKNTQKTPIATKYQYWNRRTNEIWVQDKPRGKYSNHIFMVSDYVFQKKLEDEKHTLMQMMPDGTLMPQPNPKNESIAEKPNCIDKPYYDKLLQFLVSNKGKIFIIDKLTNDRKKFINHIKFMIESNHLQVAFNNDYTKIKVNVF